MKHASIKKHLFIAAAIVVISATVPVLLSFGQPVSKTPNTDTVLIEADSLNKAAKLFKKDVEALEGRVTALSPSVMANKTELGQIRYWVRKILRKKPQVIKQKETVPIPVPIPVAVNKDKTIVVNHFYAPKYEGTKIRTHQTYFEWKHSRGLFQKKDYNTYLNKVYGK